MDPQAARDEIRDLRRTRGPGSTARIRELEEALREWSAKGGF